MRHHRFCHYETKRLCSAPMRTVLLLIGLLALPVVAPVHAGQTVWKWVDSNGVTHFADTPVPGATKVEISGGNRDSRPTPTYPSSSLPTQQPVNTGPSYRTFEISKPVSDQNFINTGGQVTVNVRIDPALQPGHQLALLLDGQRVEGFPRNALQYDLKGVPRGTHTAAAQVQDSRGTRLQETAAVTFYVRQESVASPPVGPTLRPPTKPRP